MPRTTFVDPPNVENTPEEAISTEAFLFREWSAKAENSGMSDEELAYQLWTQAQVLANNMTAVIKDAGKLRAWRARAYRDESARKSVYAE